MPKFVSAQYVPNSNPPPEQLIRAVDEDGVVWWLDETCSQGDWLEYLQAGNSVMAADAEEQPT